MSTIFLILLVLGAACFAASALGRGRYDTHVTLLPLGLLFWILVPLINTARSL